MGTMPLATIEKTRLPKYKEHAPTGYQVLWIAHEATDFLMDRNREAMLERDWGSQHLFTTSRQILADPLGEILEYVSQGERMVTSLADSPDESPAKVGRKSD